MSERRRPSRKAPKMRRDKNPGKGYRVYRGRKNGYEIYIGHQAGDHNYEYTVVKNDKPVDFGQARSYQGAIDAAVQSTGE